MIPRHNNKPVVPFRRAEALRRLEQSRAAMVRAYLAAPDAATRKWCEGYNRALDTLIAMLKGYTTFIYGEQPGDEEKILKNGRY